MFGSNISVRHLTVPIAGIPDALSGLRLAHVSDFHFRKWEQVHVQAQEALCALKPDLLLLTGDYAVNPQQWQKPLEMLCRLLEPIAKDTPIYAVMGNHDHPDMLADSSIPAVFLRNESVTLEHNGVPFEVVGVDQHHFGGEDIRAALGESSERAFTLLLAHYPSTVFRLPPGRVDLQLSGHTHGGQIRIPFFGCIWPNDKISCRMARGLHAVGGTLLHVTPGLGVSNPIPVRFRCPPEISVLTLQATITKERPKTTRVQAEVNVDPAPIP